VPDHRLPAALCRLPALTLALTGAGLSAAGCGARDETSRRMAVRDSAGVTIVESAEPAWSGDAGWVVDSVPVLDLGEVDGPAELTFDGIGVVRPLADGGLLVAQEKEIRLYDAGGAHVRTVGGPGRGPGEFQLIGGAEVCGGRILATDFIAGTLTSFGMDGSLEATTPLEREDFQSTPFLTACAGATPLLSVPLARAPSATPAHVERPAFALVVVSDEAVHADTIATLPGGEIYDGLRVPFGRSSSYRFRDSLLYTMDTGAAELRIAGLDGITRRIIRFGAEPRPVTTEDVERVRAQYLDAPPGLVEQIQPRFDALEMPATMPHFQDLFLAPDGTIWLQGYYPLRNGENRTWQVLAPDGAWLGPVTVPAGLRVHAVTEDHLIGVWRDEFDVEHVRTYAIRR
jgi:hypothetical protein